MANRKKRSPEQTVGHQPGEAVEPNVVTDSEKKEAPKTSSPEEPSTRSSQPSVPPSANSTQQEWESERRKIADVGRTSLNAYLQSSIHQRVDLLRDTLAVAVTILLGALTLYFAAPGQIKTVPRFFFSLAVLLAGVVANLMARSTIARHLDTVSFQIEANYIAVYSASREVLNSPTVTNIDTAWRTERDRPPFPTLPKRGQYGHLICIWAIIAALVGVALSFMFKVS